MPIKAAVLAACLLLAGTACGNVRRADETQPTTTQPATTQGPQLTLFPNESTPASTAPTEQPALPSSSNPHEHYHGTEPWNGVPIGEWDPSAYPDTTTGLSLKHG